jgi:hypothetical protein
MRAEIRNGVDDDVAVVAADFTVEAASARNKSQHGRTFARKDDVER